MAPTRSKKLRKSTDSTTSIDTLSFPAPPSHNMTISSTAQISTPTRRSPMKKNGMAITARQKQALIDNLQLEITERARKLRAQYAIQANGLRMRIELRVQRIPLALRKEKMGNLLLKHSASSDRQQATHKGQQPSALLRVGHSPSKNLLQQHQTQTRASPSPTRPAKRLSGDMDKENNDDLENPKKRVKAPVAPPRTTSRKPVPEQVLSPRSANSRTLPRSPAKPIVPPVKSMLARPISPLKPAAPVLAGGAAGMLTSMVEKAKSSRATATRKVTASSAGSSSVGRGRKAVTAAVRQKGRSSDVSESSEASSGSVIRNTIPAKKPPVKRTVMGTIRGVGGAAVKKAIATKPVAAEPAVRRTLRKRN